jgi:hypothetical protein
MRVAFVAAVLAAVPASGWAAQPVVLELFTSQSCSSCPPAEALLGRLATEPDVLALSLHVDYWNRTGWRDRYSDIGATDRQRAYAARLGQDDVYTPELVVDGAAGLVGSDQAAVQAAVAAARRLPDAGPPLAATRDGSALRVRVGAGTGRATVLLVGFDAHHDTAIGGGENAGRTLAETNVVRSLAAAGVWNGPALDLRLAWPRGERAAVLLQQADGRILAAAAIP